MAKPKSLIKNIQLTIAKRSHSCKSNAQHKIANGEARLTVKEGQNESNYCLECGKRFLQLAMDDLSEMQRKINES